MKKNFKLILALVLAAMMLLGSVSALAATTTSVPASASKGNGAFTITMTSSETGHTFKAYRIFDGSVDTTGKLGDISWATGVETGTIGTGTTTIYDELATAGLTGTLTTAQEVANAMKNLTDSTVLQAVADVFYARKGSAVATVTNTTDTTYVLGNGAADSANAPLVAGYYLVTDEYATGYTVPDGAETLSRNILAVVGNVTAEVKNDKPTVEKKIMDPTPVDANKAGIGDHVFYRIETKVPNYVGYDNYFFLVNDKLSDGLTFDGASDLTVKVDGTAIDASKYVVYTDTDAAPYTFRVAFKNIKEFAVGKTIQVFYSATINQNAVIGGNGNPNETDLTYSNNPNDSSGGNPSENPKPTNDIPTGTSGKDITITYVAELDLTKYKDSITTGNELDGATFTLSGTSNVVIPTTAEEFQVDANGEYYKLKTGKYTLTAPHGNIYDSNGNLAVNSNEDYYESEALGENPTKYSLKKVTTYETQQKEVFIQKTTANGGKIVFKGLSAGTYTLKETVTPAGYTTATPIQFTIVIDVPSEVTSLTQTAEYSITGVTPTGAVTLRGADATTGKATTGIYDTSVIDLSGATLPSTGGIGTTIFYIAGSILVLAAAVLLITKRRMGSND